MSSVTATLSSARSRFFGKGATSINPGLVAALIIIFVFLSFYSPYFLSTSNLMNILNPQIVIFGGPLSLAEEFLLPVIKETVDRRAWPWVQERADITIAAHGEDAPVMGSVAMVFREVLNQPRLWLNSAKE